MMQSENKILTERIHREFIIAEKHLSRIEECVSLMNNMFPLSTASYSFLSSEEVRLLDQFIFRFSKLQDCLGAKMFRYTLHLLDEDVENAPMRDVLNMLERYNLLPSVQEWMTLRELRNEVAHDYPFEVDDVVESLNHLREKWELLKVVLFRLKEVYLSNVKG